ncbi:MAG: rod-binding protein [Clostridiales bacterium]|nr:rod-binding protein [Clostridiales bacterium]
MDISAIGGGSALTGQAARTAQTAADEQRAKSFEEALQTARTREDDAGLKEACFEFESYFIQTMFREMRKTIDDSHSLLPKSNAENIFTDMLDEEYSKNLAKSGGIGLAKMLYSQISKEETARKPSV